MAPRKRTRPDLPEDADYRSRLEAAKRESTLQLLFKAARQLDERALERAAQIPGRPRLRRSHTSLLPHIDLEGTRVTDLAERLGVSKQAASQLVDDLEAVGVLAREPDPSDARARRVVFTPLGRRGLLEGLELLGDMERELARAIGDESMDQLRQALRSILEVLGRRATR
ncbi:MAG TPA: MarR family transcriptional regulator [Polyangiaceae bacterium]|jgi:DNA-binding MarR family transcriptional regulator|nr:MarR family transcriptional regulator [Polyangiaceae bacterium]